MKKLKWGIFFLILVFLFAGCDDGSGNVDNPGDGEVEVLDSLEITVPSGASTTLTAGSTLQLGVEYTPANTVWKGVTWGSSNSIVATVSANGLVTTVGPGTTTITAQSSKVTTVSDTLEITVTPVPVTGVSLNNTTLELVQYGSTKNLIATITPNTATNKTVNWESSDPAKVSVSTGATTTIATLAGLLPTDPGDPVIITVTTDDGDFTETCEVTVTAYIEIDSITLSETTLDVMEGASGTLTATLDPPDATNQTINWTSSDDTKATVSATGSIVTVNGLIVTATPVTITATVTKHDGTTTVTATCEVSVIPFDGVEAFGWDAAADPDFNDLPWQGEKTIGNITVYNFSTNSNNDGSVTPGVDDAERTINGVMRAVQQGEVVGGFTMEKAGYWLKEDASPCLEIGSNAFTRTTTSNIFQLLNKNGSPAIEGQFDLSRACKITVEYTGITKTTTGQDNEVLIAILNNTGSVNTSNSPLQNDSGAFQSIGQVGIMETYTRIFDPTTLSNYASLQQYLEKAFFIVRATKAGTSVVVHSVKIEVLED